MRSKIKIGAVLFSAGMLVLAVPAMAALTLSSAGVSSDGALTVDGLGAVTLGGSNATSVAIGSSTATTTIVGALANFTLQNAATIDNTTANQINLAGAGEAVGTRVGLLRAGFNGYGSELGGSGLNPVTITTGTGNRGGAELYYGFSGTASDMRGMRLFLDNEANAAQTGTLTGAEIEMRGDNAAGHTGHTIAVGRAINAVVLSKFDTITNAIGVQSDLDTGSSGSVGTWKALYVTHTNNQQAVTQGYGLYIDATTKQGTSGGATDGNIATMTDIYLQNAATIDNSTSGTLNLTATTIRASGIFTVTGVTALATTTVTSAANKGTCVVGTNCNSITVSSGAKCVSSDVTNASSTMPSVTSTTLTITGGTTGDSVNYLCF